MKTEHEAFGSDPLRLEPEALIPSGAIAPPPLGHQVEALGEEQEESRRYETCAGCGEEWNVSRMAREGWYICPRCAYRYGRR
nr:MAG TPA: alpha-aminoadipate carrier protein [Caudoviricetes sp.]